MQALVFKPIQTLSTMSAPGEPLSFENISAYNTPLPISNTVLDIPLPARLISGALPADLL
jgi:hypothetical protein